MIERSRGKEGEGVMERREMMQAMNRGRTHLCSTEVENLWWKEMRVDFFSPPF